jgi:hypothetical protein
MRRRTFLCGSVAGLFDLALLGGCDSGTEEKNAVTVKGDDPDCLIFVGIDLSGSFYEFMTKDGQAHKFLMRVIDTYFRNSIGANNRIVIAQLSATQRALLWDGSPVQLRQQFPSSEKFQDFLQRKCNPNGSRIYDGIADGFDYVLSDPAVSDGKTKTAVFVLSDFIDNLSDPKAEDRLARSLTAYAKTKGVIGFYFLEHSRVSGWRQHLRDAGIKQWVCESEIVASPTLPTFD